MAVKGDFLEFQWFNTIYRVELAQGRDLPDKQLAVYRDHGRGREVTLLDVSFYSDGGSLPFILPGLRQKKELENLYKMLSEEPSRQKKDLIGYAKKAIEIARKKDKKGAILRSSA